MCVNRRVFCLAVVIVASVIVAVSPWSDTLARMSQREVAVTFDDLPGVQTGGAYCSPKTLENINRRLIASLKKHQVPALGLVVESRICESEKSALPGLLRMWLDAGLQLGNHSFSHFDLNNTPLAAYQADIIRGETVTQRLLNERGQRLKYFRHPYLHAGKDLETRAALERFLFERGYKIAPVTIDNQEWVFAEVYARALRGRDIQTQRRVKSAYIAYMNEIFEFFERRSIEVTGAEIRQILLLHVNPLNADCFDELVQMMKMRGYKFISIDEALEDPAYRLEETYAGPRGLSWIHRWSISKGLGMKDEPAEPQWIKQLYDTR